ncbi:hypothetical protein L227DRAFT_601242 [Lentinus tigrinus ALCF2SS1-6]|uniref:Uncharacterized protein n=1 Tax=Lentinus tigrinus ALCF2SS1-6 TaxID=1328759 RepID=A0A5C2S6Q5_9APHY|nr:hypothetical protein L227DRAFT_601242 [Lentinus tigrinus ALCF2SS1-6]
MRAGESAARIFRSSWRRECLAQSTTTSRRILHVSSPTRADETKPKDLLASKIEGALKYFRNERAAGSSPEALVQRLAIQPVKHIPRSFAPEALSEADYVDLSGHTCQLNVSRRFSRIPTVIPYRYQPYTAFRPGTAGFFYYTSSSALPEAGEIRFRITGSPKPESFALGRDLLTANGLVWRLHLLTMVKGFDEYAPIVAKLKSEGLLTQETNDSCLKLTRGFTILSNTERVLHSLYQPFIFDFKNKKPKSLWFLTPKDLQKVSLEDWLTKNGQYALPTKGTVMLCAERPDARNHPRADPRSIVLRVLQIVRPVEYPKRYQLRSMGGDGDKEDGADEKEKEDAAHPPPRAGDSLDRMLKAYEGELISNNLGEALTYVPNGKGWPSV